MKIPYRQKSDSYFSENGITNCYFKTLSPKDDFKRITPKKHHHRGFEVHIIYRGSQIYEAGGKTYTVYGGDMLIIPPFVPHKATSAAPDTQKIGISFDFGGETQSTQALMIKISERIKENIDFILGEASNKTKLSQILTENAVFEIIVYILRAMGISETEENENISENIIFRPAIQYIHDNMENSPSVNEVARYCALSCKQLTRIFYNIINKSPGEYIREARIKYIEELLKNSDMPIRTISEKMNFSSEYYFNAFFKRHMGLPPGEYRKMLGM